MTINDNDTHLNRIAREHAERAEQHEGLAEAYLARIASSESAVATAAMSAAAQAYATLALAQWTAARAETRR